MPNPFKTKEEVDAFIATLKNRPREEVIKEINMKGMIARVVSVDGQGMMGTRDYRLDRVNLDLVKGIVCRIHIG